MHLPSHVLLFLFTSAALHAAPPTKPTTPPPLQREGWELTWHDEFDGTKLDKAKWAPRQVGKRESAFITVDSISLDCKGHLKVTTSQVDGVIHMGMIGSQGKFAQAFGRWEARIQFQHMQGHHASFWMQPAKSEKDSTDPKLTGAEVDIIEWFGVERKDGGAACNVYWKAPDGGKAHAGGPINLKPVLKPGAQLSDDYHVYALEWSEEEYVFFVDDHEVFRTREGVSHQPQYAILSLLCADWESARLDRKKLPESMLVDYVRVYQKSTRK
jgi:beta-glucanase (GH16 family)